ncbi:MAG: hypothetical protein ABEI96_09450 [Haloarculaceae archaeon]
MSDDREFGPHGWLVVGMLVVAFLVVPGIIVALPATGGRLVVGLSLRDAYLVLPLIPALGLATVAVWAAVRSRRQ